MILVLCLILLNFEFIFVVVLENVLISFLYMWPGWFLFYISSSSLKFSLCSSIPSPSSVSSLITIVLTFSSDKLLDMSWDFCVQQQSPPYQGGVWPMELEQEAVREPGFFRL